MVVIGSDSETVEGPPNTLQFYSEDLPINQLYFVTAKNSHDKFINFCNSLPSSDTTYLIFGHNLSFDLVSFFYKLRENFLEDKYEFDYRGYSCSGIYSTGLAYMVMQHRSKHKTIYVLDSFAFYKASLEKLATIFCPHLPKLKRPDWLGKRAITEDDEEGKAYAMRDAVIAYHVGNHIKATFEEYDVRPCVSVAQLAARIFRHKFVERPIPLQPMQVVYAALHSYHGGKNNRTVPRGLYKNLYSIDIVSAYPFAMSRLPSFYERKLYKGYKAGRVTSKVPEFGVYRITGTVKKCKWPILFDHKFKPIFGPFKNIWTTGPEINEGLRSKELSIDSINGYYYDAENDHNKSPFKEYVDHFFAEKDKAPTKPQREKAKVSLNSLYGKLIQKDKIGADFEFSYDVEKGELSDGTKDYIAGGLFNPFIASLITGHTRAFIHVLEHKYRALHTATDGILSLKPCQSSTNLGGIKLEFKCDAYIARTKVYICYSKEPLKETDKKSDLYPDKYIIKYARHGFHANVETLEKLIKTDGKVYEYTKVNKLKESVRRGLQVNKFEIRKSRLNLDKEGGNLLES